MSSSSRSVSVSDSTWLPDTFARFMKNAKAEAWSFTCSGILTSWFQFQFSIYLDVIRFHDILLHFCSWSFWIYVLCPFLPSESFISHLISKSRPGAKNSAGIGPDQNPSSFTGFTMVLPFLPGTSRYHVYHCGPSKLLLNPSHSALLKGEVGEGCIRFLATCKNRTNALCNMIRDYITSVYRYT